MDENYAAKALFYALCGGLVGLILFVLIDVSLKIFAK